MFATVNVCTNRVAIAEDKTVVPLWTKYRMNFDHVMWARPMGMGCIVMMINGAEHLLRESFDGITAITQD